MDTYDVKLTVDECHKIRHLPSYHFILKTNGIAWNAKQSFYLAAFLLLLLALISVSQSFNQTCSSVTPFTDGIGVTSSQTSDPGRPIMSSIHFVRNALEKAAYWGLAEEWIIYELGSNGLAGPFTLSKYVSMVVFLRQRPFTYPCRFKQCLQNMVHQDSETAAARCFRLSAVPNPLYFEVKASQWLCCKEWSLNSRGLNFDATRVDESPHQIAHSFKIGLFWGGIYFTTGAVALHVRSGVSQYGSDCKWINEWR